MDTYKWRIGAKVVAWIDLICISLAFLGVGIVAIALMAGDATQWIEAIFNDPSVTSQFAKMTPSDIEVAKDVARYSLLVYVWIFLGIFSILLIIALWAAIKLLNATELGRDPANAHNMAAKWRNVWITFLILGTIGCIVNGDYISAVVEAVIRGLFLYIVWNFMSECELKAALPHQLPSPTRVTVK